MLKITYMSAIHHKETIKLCFLCCMKVILWSWLIKFNVAMDGNKMIEDDNIIAEVKWLVIRLKRESVIIKLYF